MFDKRKLSAMMDVLSIRVEMEVTLDSQSATTN